MIPDGTPYETAWFYCISSAIYTPFFIMVLFITEAYLLAGTNSFIPVCAVFASAEFIKYTFIQLSHHRDITCGSTQGFKVVSIACYFLNQIKIMELVRNVVVLAATVCVVFVMAVLFGAEVLARHEETLMFSCLLTVLTVFPVCLHQGVPAVMHFLNGTHGSDVFTRIMLHNIQFTVLGAWLGAFVIPLDWDREWQVWPIPCSFGAMVGFVVAQVFSMLEMFAKFNEKFAKLSSKYR